MAFCDEKVPKMKMLKDTCQQTQQQDKRLNEWIVNNLANILGGQKTPNTL